MIFRISEPPIINDYVIYQIWNNRIRFLILPEAHGLKPDDKEWSHDLSKALTTTKRVASRMAQMTGPKQGHSKPRVARKVEIPMIEVMMS